MVQHHQISLSIADTLTHGPEDEEDRLPLPSIPTTAGHAQGPMARWLKQPTSTDWNSPSWAVPTPPPALTHPPTLPPPLPLARQASEIEIEIEPDLSLALGSCRRPPRARLFFWWGFGFPPLWIAGTLHLLPRFCPDVSIVPQRLPNLGRRLKARLGRGELGRGRTALVIIPGSIPDEKTRVETEEWNPLSESPAERFMGTEAEANSRLNLLISSSMVKAQQNREERKWAFRCLFALIIALGMIVVVLVVSHHVQRGSSEMQWSGPIPDSGTNNSSNLGGPASRSNRPL